ncbi:MAG: replication factor C small subunit [Halobacteriales archaeon]|nr:replication factor C small subunit [Halobacteriales archaeon]
MLRQGGTTIEEIWVEKYRPQKLDEVVGQDAITERLQSYVRTRNVPNMLFAGPAGVGKTTCAHALSHELYGDTWSDNFTELNASDERGIDVVRDKIKNFARTSPVGDEEYKVIFLDEADSLTRDAQPALRRTMEMYTNTCRFILSCNYSSNIIDPIQSRCTVFRFSPVDDDALVERLRHISEEEGVDVTEDGLEALAYVAGGDVRRAVNALQAASALGETIDEEAVYATTSTARQEEVEELLERALEGDFAGAREILKRLLDEKGISGDDLIDQMHRAATELGVDDKTQVHLMDRIGETDYRISTGGDERIQIEAFLAGLAVGE